MPGITHPGSLIHDSVLRLRAILASGITDPISATRAGSSNFVATNFPDSYVQYPFIIVKHENMTTRTMGMATSSAERTLQYRISVFGKQVSQTDPIADQVIHQLETIQYSGGAVGTIAGSLHDFRVLGMAQFDEPGARGVHRKDVLIQYKFYS